MQDLEKKLALLKVYLYGVWSRKRYIMLFSWLLSIALWATISTIPNKYETKARIYADTTSILRPLLHGIAVQEDSKLEVHTVSRTLKHREMLEYIAQNSDLHLSATTPEEYEKLLDSLKDGISITGSASSGIYDIIYQHPDPKMALKVVQLTLKKFVDANAGRTRDDAQNATDFLDQQIEEYLVRLTKSEQQLADFKRENQDNLPAQGNNYYSSLSQTQQLIDELNQAISEKEAAINSLKQQFIPTTDGKPSVNVSVSTEYDQRLSQLNDALERLRIRYTDKHPNIIELKNSIAFLERKQAVARGDILTRASQGAITSSRVGENEVLQGFALKISELTSEREVLVTRRDRATVDLLELQSKLDLIPNIETRLTELNRNYQNDSVYYQKLLSRRDSAEISRSADENTQDVKFKILDQPREASTPIGPPRILMYIGAFLVSIGLGVFVALVSSQMNSTISGGFHLQQLIGKSEIAGYVPHVDGKSIRRKKRVKSVVFITSFMLLSAVLVALVGHEVVYGQSPIIWLNK